MPSPSDSSSVASASGSRGWSDSRRGMSGRGPGGARLLLYLGLCHLGLGAMVLAFSFTSMAFTSSARVRQSCPFWAGFFVVASGIVGIISWRRPLTLVVSLFMLLSAVCVILSLAGSMLSCQNAQMVKSMLTCQVENGLCVCCAPPHSCSITEEDTLVLYLNADCHSVRHQLKDLLFSACGLSILSTIICTLSTVTCSIHIFSLDLVHLLAPHRSRSVNPECTTPQDAFLTNIMDFEEFVPPIPPPPYYPPEYTCSSETDAQSITYNGSMESPVPLYPTDCPPPYEAVMGQRAASQATVFDPLGTEVSCERGTSTAFSGEVSMDSGSLLMSEIVDIPDDSSPSDDSCLMEVGLRTQGQRGHRNVGEMGDDGDAGEYIGYRGPLSQTPESPLAGGPRARRFLRGERSNSCSSPSTATITYRSPVLHRQAVLASSCSQLEAIAKSTSPQRSSIPEFRVFPSTFLRHGATPTPSATPILSPSPASEQSGGPGNGPPLPGQPLYLRHSAGMTEKDGGSVRILRLVRSHSEPGGLGVSADTVDFGSGGSKVSIDTGPSFDGCLLPRTSLPPAAALPRKGGVKSAATGGQVPSKAPPTSPLRLPKDCHRSLGDLKVTRSLVARFLQRSKRNLSPSSEHAGSTGQGPKRRNGVEDSDHNHLPLDQVLLNPWSGSRRYPNHHTRHPHWRGHHHSHSDSRHNRHHSSLAPEGIHLRSCGDLSSSYSASLRRLATPRPPHGSSGALYSESAL
ncbi:protein ENTREP3 isoform X1 [Gasterosteus aculeatus]|uniref:Family with sequence similarity 189 member B n=1 Tax=Gasterosteus aculeatus aculeatus TaxID=481459 RepID=G3PDU4_GASAC|nr:protein FAM189B isoform X1 [Gasterosteus aculeatus aculeatus]XP_040020801.1 protein FAM189B isoform X1 [Gasterosteus aculeatus aculeatus]XP_040020803.1 protein FAM189B isoform X1 [Gasterosteus aculeatus aculeatus]